MLYPTLNEKLLDCVLKHIEEHPEEHNQGLWIRLGTNELQQETECGTQACVAGWACLLSLPDNVSYVDFCNDTPIGYSDYVHGKTKDHVRYQAQRLLGLRDDEANYLFRAGSDSIRRRIEYIKHCRGLGDPK